MGGERAALEDRPLAAFMDVPSADELHRHLQAVLASDAKRGCDLVLVSDGGPIPVHVDSVAITDEAGRPSGCRMVVFDLSELRKAQEQTRASERLLEEELRQAQKMDAIGALASNMAHDSNNVLQSILGCINVARADGTTPEQSRAFLDRAWHAVHRGGELANRLLAFARKQHVAPRPLRIDAAIAATASLLQRLVSDQIRVVVDVHAEGMRIMADPVQVEQILLNLASNAYDAMPDGGTLSLRTDVEDVEVARPTAWELLSLVFTSACAWKIPAPA